MYLSSDLIEKLAVLTDTTNVLVVEGNPAIGNGLNVFVCETFEPASNVHNVTIDYNSFQGICINDFLEKIKSSANRDMTYFIQQYLNFIEKSKSYQVKFSKFEKYFLFTK